MGARIDKLFMAVSTRTVVDGLWVGSSSDDNEKLLRKVCEALTLVKAYDPLRYKRLCHDLERIWVTILPGAWGTYQAETGSCQIDSRYVASSHPIFIASTVVHEATHARLRRFDYSSETMRVRIETACRKQEIAFARKLPDGEVLDEWLQKRMPRAEDYTYEAWATRYNQGLVAAAADFGIPPWGIKALFRVRGAMTWLAGVKRRISRARRPA